MLESFEPRQPDLETGSKKLEAQESSAPESFKWPELARRVNESQSAYLYRAGQQLTAKMRSIAGPLFNAHRTSEQNLPSEVVGTISDVAREAKESFIGEVAPTNPEVIATTVEQNVEYHDRGREYGSSEDFDQTQRRRKFFEAQSEGGSTKYETYWNTLFFPFNTEATRELAKNIIDNKTVVLFGGGRSRLKAELNDNGIQPKDVINVDPFVDGTEPGADRVVALSAADTNLAEKLKREGVSKVDEIWAEYSVPAYLENASDIKQMLVNIDGLLSDGGIARIWPLQVHGRGAETDLLERKQALVDGIKELAGKGNYEVELSGSTLMIHKLETPGKEVAGIETAANPEQEKSEQVVNNLDESAAILAEQETRQREQDVVEIARIRESLGLPDRNPNEL